MGLYVSGWRLARAVSLLSQPSKETLGTISGVALGRVMSRILQMGGTEAFEIIRVLRNSPYSKIREYAEEIISRYYLKSNVGVPVYSVSFSSFLIKLIICTNYAFVTLAKEGHDNPVSMNYLEKIAMPHVFAIYGAMLAGVDYITMGAGIPLHIPAIIDAYMEGRPASYKIPVIDSEDFEMVFDPKKFFGEEIPLKKRPGFIPIISSNVLGMMLSKKLGGKVSGFVVEEPTAGGHNAPPRNKIDYGPKDFVNYLELAKLGIPFWIGGSYASSEKLAEAISLGAEGIQAGSIFALCDESGLDQSIRREIRRRGFNGTLGVRTDMRISPTGYPFKLVILENTISELGIYSARTRICDQGALVSLYKRQDGTIGTRCASEPIDDYVRKGGKIEDTAGRGCICNALISNVGLRLPGEGEPAGVTLGDNVSFLKHLMHDENSSYTAEDAVKYLLGA